MRYVLLGIIHLDDAYESFRSPKKKHSSPIPQSSRLAVDK